MKNRKIKIVFLFMVFVFGIGIFFHEFMAVSAETRYRAKHVRGTYEGYFETSQGSKVVTRKAKIVISYCDEEGNFSGTFLITDGKPGECSIEGMVDFSTGEITIKQTKWIHSSSGLSLRTYIGTLNFIDGVIYGQQKNSNRQFELTKINGTIHSLTKESIPKYWIGEYDGRYSGSTVRRGYALSITDINDDGSFTGIGVISKKENALHQVSGSYYLTGEINFSTGYIKYKGNKWIQRADSNFTFIQMIGVINKGVIAGYTENGTVDMFATSKEFPMTTFEVDKED